MKRIMRAFKISEISSVDRPAQEGARVLLMKRDESQMETVEQYVKRTFDAAARRSAASSGAAEPDGSFPIENAGDLHNAMRAIGRSKKNPAKTKAHIRARARALGLTSELSPAFKAEGDGMFANLFGLFKGFTGATATLSESVKSIVSDPDARDKPALIDETIKQFSDHVENEFEKTLSAGHAGDTSEEAEMSVAILKALGLADTATEADALAAVAKRDLDLDIAKAAMTAEEKEFHDRLDGEDVKKAFRGMSGEERAQRMKKREAELPADIKKALADLEDLKKRNAALEAERDLASFKKRALDLGCPESKAEVLLKAHGGDIAAIEDVFAMLKAAHAAIEEGGALRSWVRPAPTAAATRSMSSRRRPPSCAKRSRT